MNRRQFLLTTAAGFILPSFFDKAFSFSEQFGEPLIVKPDDVTNDCSCVIVDRESWSSTWAMPGKNQPP